MKILFVEDNDGFAGDLQPVLLEIEHVKDVVRARDREAALALLESEIIDLVVLDLSIPPSTGTSVPDKDHGQYVFHQAQMLRPGTPIFILTGSEADKFSRGLARFGNQVRLWGNTTEVETVSYFLKEEVTELVDRVTAMAAAFGRMESIAINTRGKNLGLTPIQIRMLKSYANSADCVACDVSLLSGGLSDAKVVKSAAVDQDRKAQALCAAKLGARGIISAEKDAYDRHVRKLAIGACPTLFSVIDKGVGQHGSIFYTLTDDDTLSLFDRLKANPDLGPVVVDHVRVALGRWSEAATADMVTFGDIRRRMIDDAKALTIYQDYEIEYLRGLEDIRLQASVSCIHGDLHCGNVLVKSTGEAVIIDFGDAGLGYTALDPIALELSLIFHPDAKKLGLGDSLMDTLKVWPDIEGFVTGSPLRNMIIACRDWAHDVGGGDLAVLAAAYAYGLRQLKYKSVPAHLTISFLKALEQRSRS